MIKAIIFDYGGVFSEKTSFRDFCDDFCKTHTSITANELWDAMIPIWNKAKVGALPSSVFWSTIAECTGVSDAAIRTQIIDYFGFRPEMLTLARTLQKNGYVLGMLSNQIEDWFEEAIATHALSSIFSVIVVSYTARLAKPDILIYEHILSELGLSGEECVFVDDMMRNMPSAEAVGMKTIVFHSYKQLVSDLEALGILTTPK